MATQWKDGDLVVCNVGDVPWAIVTFVLADGGYEIHYGRPNSSPISSGLIAHTTISAEEATDWRLLDAAAIDRVFADPTQETP